MTHMQAVFKRLRNVTDMLGAELLAIAKLMVTPKLDAISLMRCSPHAWTGT
jgi:hypothetical protein